MEWFGVMAWILRLKVARKLSAFSREEEACWTGVCASVRGGGAGWFEEKPLDGRLA